MGLDQFVYSIPANLAGDQITDLNYDTDNQQEIKYWRKFNSLHGWMQELYVAKGGEDPDFNCNTVRLKSDDLDKLEADAKAKALQPTSGFFFGDTSSSFSDADRNEVLDFVYLARRTIADGCVVVYNSWW